MKNFFDFDRGEFALDAREKSSSGCLKVRERQFAEVAKVVRAAIDYQDFG